MNAIIGGFHDSVLLYGYALNETLAGETSARIWRQNVLKSMF